MNNSPPPPPDPNEPKLNQLKDRGFKSTFEQSPTKNHVERRNKTQQEHRAQLLNQRRGAQGHGLANGNSWMHPGATPSLQSLRPDLSMNGISNPSSVNSNGASSLSDTDGDNAMGDDQQSSGFSVGRQGDSDGTNHQPEPVKSLSKSNSSGEADGVDALLESFAKLSVAKPKVEKCIVCLNDVTMDKGYVPHVYECLEKQDNDMRLERIRAYQRDNHISMQCRWGVRCHHRDEAHFMDYIHPDGHPGPRLLSLSKQEMDPKFLEPVRMVKCPICDYRLADFQMNGHLDTCTKERKMLSQQSAQHPQSSSSAMHDAAHPAAHVHSNAMPRPPNQRPPSQPLFGGTASSSAAPNIHSASDFSYPKDPLDDDDDDKSDDEDDNLAALNLPQVVAFSEHAVSVKNEKGEREYQEVLRKMEQMGINQKALKATMNKHQKDSKQQQPHNAFPPQKPPPGAGSGFMNGGL